MSASSSYVFVLNRSGADGQPGADGTNGVAGLGGRVSIVKRCFLIRSMNVDDTTS